MEIERFIVVRLEHEAIHCWPNVSKVLPEKTHLHFLQYPHRHIFYIQAVKKVTHNDRDIEIIEFKNQINNYLTQKYNHNWENKSCEMIGEELLSEFGLEEVQVLEDNENGAIIKKKKDCQ